MNDTNKMLARGLCRKCYDALPERKAKRSIYTKWLNSIGGKVKRRRNRIVGLTKAEYNKKWCAENKDKKLKYNKTYREKHPEKARAWSQKYYLNHKEQVAEKNKRWAANNRERINARRRELYKLKRGGAYDSKTQNKRDDTAIN